MATVKLTIGKVGTRGAFGGTNLVWIASSRTSETITSSGTSQQASFTAADGDVVKIHPIGGAIATRAGVNPTAVGTDPYQAQDDIEYLEMKAGEKLAVIDPS